MAGASVTVQVEPESVLADRSFLNTRGEPLAWLDVGDRGELALYGAPDALLRLAAGLIATADRAERLADDQQQPSRGRPSVRSALRWAGGGARRDGDRRSARPRPRRAPPPRRGRR